MTDPTTCLTDGCGNEPTHVVTLAMAGGEHVHRPCCAECYAARFARGMEAWPSSDLDGVIHPRALIGTRPDGTVAPGAYDSFYRPPRETPDDHHELPIVIGQGDAARLMWQQAPPVHVRGARLDTEREQRRRARRKADAALFGEWAEEQRGQIAEYVGGDMRAAREAAGRRRSKP